MARILLAEDDASVRRFLARKLETAGHEVMAFADGEDALPVINTSAFDVIVTDIIMPGMDGMTLARRAVRANPNIRVIFITGFAAVAMKAQQQYGAFTRVLSKPFHLSSLVEAVEQALAVREAPTK